jgi:hypothetical protein
MMNALLVASRTQSDDKGGWQPVGRLEHIDNYYQFVYTKGARMLPGFRPFHGMENLETLYVSEELFPIFANRILPQSRPEYVAYLRWSGFDPDNPPEPLSILGVTEGIRQTDSIELFPCPSPDTDGCYLNRFFLHGLRWMPKGAEERIGRLKQGEELFLMADFCNKHDPFAVTLRTEGLDRYMIGYVPRYLARDVCKLASECHPDYLRVFVERVNGDAPLQQRLLCRMNACWPDDFEPCSGEEFEPIPAGIPARCASRLP